MTWYLPFKISIAKTSVFAIECLDQQQTEVKDTGRWFDGDERSPFLNKGVMKAVFQSVGKSPVFRL